MTVSPIAAGNWYFRIHVEGRATHCGNRALAIRPGGPGDAIGVNALEKAVKIVVALQELEQQWGLTKSHPYFMPGFFSLLPGVFRADPGLDIPFYFPHRAEIAYSLWYPPDETADDVRSQIEEHVLTVSRLDPWLRDHPPRFDWINNWPAASTAVGASGRADSGCVARARQRGDDRATEPGASGRLRRGVGRVVLRSGGHPECRLRSR